MTALFKHFCVQGNEGPGTAEHLVPTCARVAVTPGPNSPGTKADVGTRIPLKANMIQGPNSLRGFGNLLAF